MKTAPLALAALLYIAGAQAADVSAGYLYWNPEVRGSATTSDSRLDLHSDLGVESRDHSFLQLGWDTGPGWWPDVAASYARLRADGRRSITRGGVLFPPQTATASAAADLRDVDLSLRYPVFTGERTRLALGLTLKQLSGEVRVQDETDSSETREAVDELFPMVQLRLLAAPADWLTLEAGGNFASYQGDRAYDYRAQGLMSWGSLSFSAGWMTKAYRVNTGSYLVDARLGGPVLGLGMILR